MAQLDIVRNSSGARVPSETVVGCDTLPLLAGREMRRRDCRGHLGSAVAWRVAARGQPVDASPSCVVSPSGKFLARMDAGEGIVVGHIDVPAAEMDRWTGIATYRIDRRPDLYR